ncbi:hypothetical protein [Elioraea rosea]|uniref:hypothetical protein n=1 Tax=Elioraea rosea TaxID=2492390 RepID=UPI001EF5709A|nr:hypothetical protein [Elioraea rosea]
MQQAIGVELDRRSSIASSVLPRARALGTIVVAGGLLVWPAWMNGYPIIFVDTAAYLLHTITGEAPWDKTAAYGPFLHLFHQGVTLWLPLLAQGLILSTTLWLVQRVACGEANARRHILVVLVLAVLTSAPWFSSTLMPDYFTPIVVLCIYLLGFGDDRLSRAEVLAVALLGVVAMAVHLSHLPTALALIALVVVVRRRWTPVVRTVLPMAVAVLVLLGANLHAFNHLTLSAHGSVFLLARLQADGPATWTLRDRCPEARWYLCDFIDRMPMDSDHFLWNPTSPPAMDTQGQHRPMGAPRLAPEAREIVAATLRDYPLAVARAAALNWLSQLSMMRVGDTFDSTDLDNFADHVLARGFPARERVAFEASAQMQGTLAQRAESALLVQAPFLILCTLALLVGAGRSARQRDGRALGLILCVALGVSANAFATGALSKPHDRYQARIVWLIPAGAMFALWAPNPALPPQRRRVA